MISTLRPTLLLDLYDEAGAEDEARDVEATMAAIIDELAA